MKHETDQSDQLATVSKALERGDDPFPFIIEIHPTDICNHRCDYCFHGGVGFQKDRLSEVLELSQYKQLFGEMSTLRIHHLTISGGGEPFADSRTPEILRSAVNNNLIVRVVSHGNFLTAKLIDDVLLCRELRVSMDAVSPATYSRVRHVPESLFHRTIQNLGSILCRKNELGATTLIGVTFLLNKENFIEVEEFCKTMLDKGVDAVVIKQDIYAPSAVDPRQFEEIQAKLEQFADPRIEIRDGERLEVFAKPCFVPHFKATFNPYGELFSCPLGAQPGETNGYLLGNLQRQTLRNIWETSAPLRRRMGQSGVKCRDCNHTDSRLNRDLTHALQGMPIEKGC